MAAAHSVEAATGRPPYTETIRTIWLAAHRRPYAAKPLIIPNSSFLIPNSSFDNSQFTEEPNSYELRMENGEWKMHVEILADFFNYKHRISA